MSIERLRMGVNRALQIAMTFEESRVQMTAVSGWPVELIPTIPTFLRTLQPSSISSHPQTIRSDQNGIGNDVANEKKRRSWLIKRRLLAIAFHKLAGVGAPVIAGKLSSTPTRAIFKYRKQQCAALPGITEKNFLRC